MPKPVVPKLVPTSASARSQDIARRLSEAESKKAVVAIRLQRELRMKPHEAVAVAKELVSNPAIARMDLESVNLRSLVADFTSANKASAPAGGPPSPKKLGLGSIPESSTESGGGDGGNNASNNNNNNNTLSQSASAPQFRLPDKPVKAKKAADGIWADIVKFNCELAVIEEEKSKEAQHARRERFSETLSEQMREQARLKAEADAKEAAFVAEQQRQQREWQAQQRKQLADTHAKRQRNAADIKASLDEKVARAAAERAEKLRADAEAIERAKAAEAEHQRAIAAQRQREKEVQEQSKRDNAARLEAKARETAAAKARDIALAEEYVRLQEEKEAARLADVNARAAKIQAKMNKMAEVQKEVDQRANDDARRAAAEVEKRNREADEAIRERERLKKQREAEAKLVIDAQLKAKAVEKMRRKQEEMELAARQREAVEKADAAEREQMRKKHEQLAAVQQEQRRQIIEHADKMRKHDETDVELKLNQSVIRKMEELKQQTTRSPMKKTGQSSSAAALRARDRATAMLLADLDPESNDHPVLARIDAGARRFS